MLNYTGLISSKGLISSTASRRHDRLPLIILISDICEDYKVVEMMARRRAIAKNVSNWNDKVERFSLANMNFNSCPLLINLHKLYGNPI